MDRAVAATTGFTRDFQHLITRYAWDEIWARPGLPPYPQLYRLDRPGRPLSPRRAGHARARGSAQRPDPEEIGEVLLQTAIYCGVAATNAAFAVAQRVLAEED